MRQKVYKGRPVIAINFTDQTQRMNEKINKLRNNEEKKQMELAIY